VLVDRKSGKVLSDQEFHLVCEAKAAEATKERVKMINARKAATKSAPAVRTAEVSKVAAAARNKSSSRK
jgi:hypothetical protein